jgi:tetratricopeptide (TPR) repeat protein
MQLLQDLHAELTGSGVAALSQAVALAGLGGIGKTQTAVEYAYCHFPADYDWVFWVKADTELNAITDLANIGRSLDLSGETLDELATQTRHWLETHDRWLLIFDNADQPELLKSVLPRGHQGKVLLTSRARRFASLGIKAPIEVQRLSPEESIAFLKDRAQQSDLDAAEFTAAKELVRELDGLPLALEQAAAYITQMQVGFGVYLRHYRQKGLALLERLLPETGDYPASVATTWQLNFEEVERRSLLAAQILQVSSVWASDGVWEAQLQRAELELVGAVDGLTLAEGLAALASFSLIERNRENSSYSIHRMVQEVVWHGLSNAQQQDWLQRVIGLFDNVFPDPAKIDNWQFCGYIVPHVQAITLRLETQPIETLKLAHLFNQTGYFLDDQGRYTEVEPLYERALSICEQQLGADHPQTATSLNNLAGLYESMGRYAEAEPLYVLSLSIRKQQLGADHPDVAQSLNNSAALYCAMGRYAQAEPLYVLSLSIREQQLGADHPDTANSLNNLAKLYLAMGRYSEAEPLFVRALAIDEQELGADHPDTATSLNNLAGLFYLAMGRYPEAEPLYKRALSISEQQLGADHPDTASSLNNLAVLYVSMGRYAEAEPLYKRALSISKQQLGADHPSTATSLNNLAALYESMGCYAEAEPLFVGASIICFNSLGQDHPNTQTVIGNFFQFLQTALTENRIAELSDHPLTQEILTELRSADA